MSLRTAALLGDPDGLHKGTRFLEDECCTAGSWGLSTFLRLGVTSARDLSGNMQPASTAKYRAPARMGIHPPLLRSRVDPTPWEVWGGPPGSVLEGAHGIAYVLRAWTARWAWGVGRHRP